MLKSLDIVIGFSVVMLMVSMSVTLITEWVLRLLGMRGKKLLEGVTALLHQIDPTILSEAGAREIAEKVLTHPLASRTSSKLAEVVQREDLIKIVLNIAASAAARLPQPVAAAAAVGGAAAPPPPPPGPAPSDAERALVTALQRTGIADPAATLDGVRMLSMRLEASRPELATHVREAMAIIAQAESQFVAKVNGWFDQSMDRVSHSFAKNSHYWTVAISMVLAFALQLDAINLVNRLAVDDSLRTQLVNEAQKGGATDTTGPVTDLQKQTRENVEQLKFLASDKLISWPPFSPSRDKNGNLDWSKLWSNFPGVLLSGLLISLGAPFWFNTLGNLVKLRPALAAKEDAQRTERQTTQAT